MLEHRTIRVGAVIGPFGEALTLDSLPSATTTRWVVRRKAEVVAAVSGGLLSIDEACDRYAISFEEFTGWQRAVTRSGVPGLRVTRSKPCRAGLAAKAIAPSAAKPQPRPMRADLEKAEMQLERAEADHAKQERAFQHERATLRQREEEASRAFDAKRRKLVAQWQEQVDAYDEALTIWRAS